MNRRKILLRSAVGLTAAAAAAACASANKTSGAQPLIVSNQGQPAPLTVQWSGKFANTTKQSGDLTGARGNTGISGDVRLTALTAEQIQAAVKVQNAKADAGDLLWAIVPGGCGSNALPALAVTQFPPISINSFGRGEVTGPVNMPLPTSGQYHVNLYLGHGGDESDVYSCANLKMETRK